MKNLAYEFKNEKLLKQALTHPSLNGEDNQRLEFLGDAVLEYAISIKLYQENPKLDEGGLTHLRANLVCQGTLDKVGRKIQLNQYILLNKSQELDGGRENPAILSDAMEAVIGAVCLDGGVDKAQKMIEHLWKGITPAQEQLKDDKSLLQEQVQSVGKEAPVYRIFDEQGPPHQRVFFAEVTVDEKVLGAGKGKSKRQAEQNAAKEALGKLKVSVTEE